MVAKNVLWIQNICTSDVILGDLNVKVSVGKTVNVFKSNPNLTADQVEKSMESGSLFKRISGKLLRQVKGPAEVKAPIVDQKQTAKTVVARKTKTSVVIDPSPLEEEGTEDKGFEFADYGVSDVVKHEKDEKGAIVVNVQQDEVKTSPPVSPNSKEIIENLRKKAVNPIGPVAKMSQPEKAPFVVVDNRKQTQTQEPEKSVVVSAPSPQDELPPTQKTTKTQNGMVVVGGDGEEPPRSLKAIAKGTQDTEMIPDDDVDGADKVIEGLQKEGMRIATKTEDGVVVMQVSDDDAADKKPVAKKPRTSKKT